ncbi:MAG: hypothetical protein ACX931_12490 [Saccharospirillum sp.]
MFYGSSDIVDAIESSTLPSGQPAERLRLRGGPVLVLSERALALYRHQQAVDDPLGNGLIQLQPLPSEHQLVCHEGQFVEQYRAGYIGLIDDKALLVTPVAIQLFANREDALRNHNPLARLDFE